MKMRSTILAMLLLAASFAVVHAGAVHRYSFDGDASDSIGNDDGMVVDGTSETDAAFADGQLVMNNSGGSNDNPITGNYVDFPNGLISSIGNELTLEFWSTWHDAGGGVWQEMCAFGRSDAGEDASGGAGGSPYIMITPKSGDGGTGNKLRFGYRNPSGTEWVLDALETAPVDEEFHVAVTWDGLNNKVTLYVNGVFQSEGELNMDLSTDLEDLNCWLCRSNWPDTLYLGSFNEFRLYNTALSSDQVRVSYEAGADADVFGWVATDPDPADGDDGVELSSTLTWVAPTTAPAAIDSYNVYLGTDPNQVVMATDASPELLGSTTTESINATLQPNLTYYWRVDVLSNGQVAKGDLWTFDSQLTVPVITAEPTHKAVDAGGSVSFTLEEINGSSYAWYKDDVLLSNVPGKISGATTTTLTISDADLTDEASYFCVVTNAVGDDTSATVTLIIKQLFSSWSFEEGTGTTTADAGVAGFDLAIQTVTWTTDGFQGNALDFDGSLESYLVMQDGVGDPNALPVGDDSYTLAAWVKSRATSGSRGIIGWGNYGGGRQNNALKLVANNQIDNYWWGADLGVNFNNAWPYTKLDDGEWHYVVATYDRDVRSLYLDGAKIGSDNPGDNAIPAEIVHFAVGATNNEGERFDGIIDEVKIYNYALEASEIADTYVNLTGKQACQGEVDYDFNGDCIVNVEDFKIFAENWMGCQRYPDCVTID